MLVQHAQNEMKLAGLYEKSADYDGMIPEAVMELVTTFSKQDHSGYSAMYVLDIFNKLARFDNLTPLTSSPMEWMEVVDGLWQSKRTPNMFSTDGGQHYYNVEDPNKIIVKAENPTH